MSMTELSPTEVEQVFSNALQQHQSGNLDQAERLYGQVVAADPRHFDGFNLLGLIALQTNRNDKAADYFKRAIAISDKVADVHNNIGEAYRRLGQADLALAHFGKAVEVEPAFTMARQNHGQMLLALGRRDEAVAEFRKIVEAEPSNAKARATLTDLLMSQGAGDQAAGYISDAPDSASALKKLIHVKIAANDIDGAINAATRLALDAPDAEAKILFVHAVSLARDFTVTADLRKLIAVALAETWGRPSLLAHAAASFLKATSVIANAISRLNDPKTNEINLQNFFGPFGLPMLGKDDLFCAYLENTPNRDPQLEKLLTVLRFLMLDQAAHHAPFDETLTRLYCALARQCFINGYAFAIQPAEESLLVNARQELTSALMSGRTPHPLLPIAIAAYEPLYRLAHADNLLKIPAPPPMAALFTQQIREPVAEQEIGVSIPHLVDIEDETSLAVQAQYEENPYPTWTRTTPPPTIPSFDASMTAAFPLTYRPLGKTHPDILIAGCGTGQHSVETAQLNPGSRILAIDLSLASLSYAARKSREAGVKNVEYAQADILKLGGLGRDFDVIESSGVLHHLREPLAGWQVLMSLLRPGGVMRIGLYSRIARRHINEARAFVKDGGFQSNADGIRRFRQSAIFSKNPSLQWITNSGDFYSLSACRDLVFHVQEHQFTLPEIKTILEQFGLTLLGFDDLAPAVFTGYRKEFPDDPQMTNLEHWHVFEQKYPHMFGGMYQFWTQKQH